MKLSNVTAVIIGLVLLVVLVGSNYTVPLSAPGYAIVYANTAEKIYYAPPYIDIAKPAGVDVARLKRMTLKEAVSLNFTPDRASLEKGYFRQQYRTLPTYLLEKMGLISPLPLRWNKDGAWNW